MPDRWKANKKVNKQSRRLCFQKERAVVIGDSLASDIQGAQNAGLDSIWYHPDGSWKNPVSVPYTYEAKNYGDILRILLP